MKKLLLVLLVVALASFLFVGCLPTTPAEGEGEGEGEVVEGACPTVSITSEVEIAGKKYIKGASQTITVTFAEATEPVSVYVASTIKGTPAGVPADAVEVVMYPDADKKVWTGKYRFGIYNGTECKEGYVYVTTCATCAPCKFPYVVDEYGPCSSIKIYEYPSTGCSCGGVNIRFVTPSVVAADCLVPSYCGDTCSGLDTYTIDLYKADPFGTCCDIPCLSPIATCSGTGCNIDCTISCLNIYDYVASTVTEKTFYAVATLLDKVGNKTSYYAQITLDSDDIVKIEDFAADGLCTDWTPALHTVTGTTATTLTIGTPAGDYGECPGEPAEDPS